MVYPKACSLKWDNPLMPTYPPFTWKELLPITLTALVCTVNATASLLGLISRYLPTRDVPAQIIHAEDAQISQNRRSVLLLHVESSEGRRRLRAPEALKRKMPSLLEQGPLAVTMRITVPGNKPVALEFPERPMPNMAKIYQLVGDGIWLVIAFFLMFVVVLSWAISRRGGAFRLPYALILGLGVLCGAWWWLGSWPVLV